MDLVWSRDAEKLNNKLNSAFPDHSYFTDYGSKYTYFGGKNFGENFKNLAE